MSKTVGIVSIVVLLSAAFLVYAASSSTFLYKHRNSPELRITIGANGAAIVDAATPEGRKRAKLPDAYAPETEFDFGVMDPLADGMHEFVIRNRGNAPLKLRVGDTTCKCTVGGISNDEIAPGEEGKVKLTWNTGRFNLFYSHYAAIETNDPFHKMIDFNVRGKVRQELNIDVPEVVVPKMQPGSSTTVSVLLYSQMHDNFRISNLKSNIKGFDWKAETLTPADMPGYDAKMVQRLTFTLPATMPQGAFSDTLQLQVLPGDVSSTPIDFTIPLQGRMGLRFTMYGSAISSTSGGEANIDLGSTFQGQAKSTKVLVKIRDDEPVLENTTFTLEPNFLKAELTPHVSQEAVAGLYDLVITIPEDAPACQFLGSPPGKIRIKTGHPRIGDVEFDLHLIVTEP